MKPVRRKKFGKPLSLGDRILMFLVYWLGSFSYRLLCSTYRVRLVGKAAYARAQKEGGIVGLGWHQRLLCGPYMARKIPRLAFLVSLSKDGEMIRYMLEGLGFKAIQGSSSRSGSTAFREMSRHLESGGNLAITPDGPRGPARRVKPGVARLALDMGLTLYPCTIAAREFWLASSWDRFLFPKPFTEVVFHWGNPIHVKKGGGQEKEKQVARLLEESLDRLTDEADRAAGHSFVPRGKEIVEC